MLTLLFDLVLSSLYSIRLPYTAQTAPSYPLPPPSVIKGLLANALQRYEGILPEEAVKIVNGHVTYCTAQLNGRLVRSECTITVIRFGRAMPRDIQPKEFLHCPSPITCAIFMDGQEIRDRLYNALHKAPIFIGDSESLAIACNVNLDEAKIEVGQIDQEVTFSSYAPLKLFKQIKGEATVFKVVENLLQRRETPELVSYVFPLKVHGNIIEPVQLQAILNEKAVIIGARKMRIVMPILCNSLSLTPVQQKTFEFNVQTE